MSERLPQHTRVVVIGGGVIGASVAYHLTKLGWSDVVLLERDRLTSGTTWHAAGLIASAGMSSETLLWAEKYSRDLYQRLEAETGLSTGFMPIGHVQLATSDTRRRIQRREQNFARLHGVEKHELSPAEVKALFPLVETEGVRVTDLLVKDRRVTGVRTTEGDVAAEAVVLAAGMWSRQLAARAGVSVPLQAAEHYYLLTEAIPAVRREWPIVEDPDGYAYVREEGGGLLFGLFEPGAATWKPEGIPEDGSFLTLPPDWERMTPFLEHAFKRFPVMNEAGIKTFFCGPESFTPDGGFLMGEAPEVDGLFVATGMNSLGILSAGGVGSMLAEQIVHGNASQDTTGLALSRTQPYQSTRSFLAARTPEMLGYVFNHAGLPNYKLKTARDVRRLALHDRYVGLGASFVTLSGWEMPLWFSQDGRAPKVEYRYGRQPWFEYAAVEHRATRECVGLFDKSFMGKFVVQGRDTERVLNRVSANSVSVPVGRNVYTQWLNRQGGIISDLTITRLDEQEYLLVTGDVLQRPTPAWLRQHTGADEHCWVTDVTSAYTLLSVQGPRSRELLASISGADLSTERLPFRATCQLEVGHARVLTARMTYMGELGYELYVPTEYSHAVHDALLGGCQALGIPPVHCGLMALDSLRLEKGYRDFGVDIDNTDTPLEAGLGFVVDLEKGDFTGRDALVRQKALGPPRKRLVQFLLDDPGPLLVGREPIRCDGRLCGYVRAGAFGHTLGASVGLGVIELEEGITADLLRARRFEIEVDDQVVGARASLAPMYDPKSERVRG